jgi:hypothetical protein
MSGGVTLIRGHLGLTLALSRVRFSIDWNTRDNPELELRAKFELLNRQSPSSTEGIDAVDSTS